MKGIQKITLLIFYFLISGCGLIFDIANLASGRPSQPEPREKTVSESNLERMTKQMDRDMAEMREEGDRRDRQFDRECAEQRQRAQEHQEAILESLKRGDKIKFP